MANILLIPEKSDPEREAVAQCWARALGPVRRVGKFWEKPEVSAEDDCYLYGNDVFVLVLAQKMGLELLTVDESATVGVSAEWTKREMGLCALGEVKADDFPVFIKPFVPKSFKAGVYPDLPALLEETRGMAAHEKLIRSSVISIEAEWRCFVCGNEVLDISCYEGEGSTEPARGFAEAFLQSADRALLPVTFVMDIGYNARNGFFLIEFNSCWGAGLNGCDPGKVLPAIKAATVRD